MGSTIAEAQQKVDQAVHLKKGYSMEWQGDFENQQRASKRLTEVVPISLLLIFLLLFAMFGNLKDAGWSSSMCPSPSSAGSWPC
jgi:cobalt-zinc-cadmium resistance protein CzcA